MGIITTETEQKDQWKINLILQTHKGITNRFWIIYVYKKEQQKCIIEHKNTHEDDQVCFTVNHITTIKS